MLNNYLLYPEALEKLVNSGIQERIEQLKKSKEGLWYIGGFVDAGDVVGAVGELKEEGYYKHLPADFKKKYVVTMNEMLKDSKQHNWTIKKPAGVVTSPCDYGDLQLFTGIYSSMVLKPEEFGNYESFGFSSAIEFLATVSAFVIQESRGDSSYREGYKWEHVGADGVILTNEITGDGNSDLRIYQTDITQYLTIDPFGNKILMRPEIRDDKNVIATYHSTEATLLIGVLKYVDQQKIKTTVLAEDAKELLAWGRSLGQGGGTCAEHFGGFDHEVRSIFMSYFAPMSQLDENNETDKMCRFWLTISSERAYGMYIAHDGDLAFSCISEKKFNPKKSIRARFAPEEADHLIKGLIYQSAKGLGRTSAKQLLDIIEYRFSPQFEADKKEFSC